MNNANQASTATLDTGRIRIGGAARPMPMPPLAVADFGRIRVGGAARPA